MKKSRLESFSDGVLAIVITLLILNVKLPEVNNNNLGAGLLELLPTVEVYMLSFLLIGMYWIFHHHTFSFVNEVDGIMTWLNILFLLTVSFLPFPTSLVGKYPNQTLPIVVYGANLILVNITGFAGLVYINRNRQLCTPVFTKEVFRSQMKLYLGVNGFYIICIAMAFFKPRLSIYMFGIMTAYLIIRSAAFMGIGKCKIIGSK
jgi:uncharacterized membrane protein